MLEALFFPEGEVPEISWVHGDDLCDCTFQRIGEISNPYLAHTEQIRYCCLMEELRGMFPHLFRSYEGYTNPNSRELTCDPVEWNGDTDMPPALWHRQIQAITGKPLDEIRMKAGPPPKGVIRGN